MHTLKLTPHSSFSKVDSLSAPEQEAAAFAARSAGCVEAAAPGLDRRRETEVFPGWDWIMYYTLCSTEEGAQRVHVSTSPGEREGSAGAARALKFAVS